MHRVVFLAALVAAASFQIAQTVVARDRPERLHRYWPRFPRPRVLLTVAEVRSQDEAFLLQSVAGLAARSALNGSNREMVWYPIGHPAYLRWHEVMLKQTRAREETLPDVWAVVERFRRAGIVKGYVLFRKDNFARQVHEHGEYDPSPNIATVAAARLQGVLVSETLEDEARHRGLPLLVDVRSMTEEEAFERWGSHSSRRAMTMLDPKLAHCRAEAIAQDTFVTATYGSVTEKALARLEPDSPVLGWGIGDEWKLTEPISRWAAFQTATNWSVNLSVLSTEQVGETIPLRSVRARKASLWDLTWEEGLHYTAFLMTDGDNVQWLMADFQIGHEKSWWDSPVRGRFPMGWGTCAVDLLQVCPYAWQNLIRTATPRDDLILMGGGYYYPDLFGKARNGTAALRLHARRIRGYLRATGIRVLHMNAGTWDSPDAVRAYQVFAEEIPELEGILMVQYAPYTAGQGKIIWVRRKDGSPLPVISARYAIWGRSPFPNDGPPAEVARRLNAEPRFFATSATRATPTEARIVSEETPAGISWVTVHCWSWFREAPHDAPEDAEEVDQAQRPDGAKRGLEPVEWCVRRLAPHVRVVTPTELVRLTNLHLRPQETLSLALNELERQSRSLNAARRKLVSQQVERARAALAAGRYREAFLAGKAASKIVGTLP